ncbi:MAG TPA: hypothetical protein VFP98_01770, partial [Candidatus Polarisedimenticolia bacterium]|nr:hypothetical protein [Candidatus Polarisedimenticolia bacterium]
MKWSATLFAAVTALLLGAETRAPLANCGALPHTYQSTAFIRTSLAFPHITEEFGGVWWSLGFGDPGPGAGADNGLYPSGDLQLYGGGCDYGIGCWLYAQPF